MKRSDTNHRPILPVVMGVDVGGTKVAAAIVDRRGDIYGMVRKSTDVSTPAATLECITQVIRESLLLGDVHRSQVLGVGLGVPGLVDPERGLGIASVNLGWNEIPVRDEMQRRVGFPCAVENDVRAAALGEARFGAGRRATIQLFLVIGTGIAAALVLDQRIYRGAHNLAGEIGHAVLDPEGPLCKCGARGCFEALAAGPAISARYAQKLFAANRGFTDIPQGSDGSITAETVYRLAREGDQIAHDTVEETSEYIAHALQILALAYDPEIIVIGGGVSAAGSTFLAPVREALERRVARNLVLKKVYTSGLVQLTQLGKEIGVLGAAALVAPAEWSFDQLSEPR